MHTAVSVPPTSQGDDRLRSFGIVSTFPPTSCGIATFSAALAAGLIADGATVEVVRCGPAPEVEDVLVAASLAENASSGRPDPIETLNGTDLVLVQHEYGLYEGPDGESIVALMEAIDAPIVLVAHTVLVEPTPNQRVVLERACAVAEAVVVMTETARARLLAGFEIDSTKVSVIPHGAATPPARPPGSDAAGRGRRRRVLTWGLLGPGKGIEWAIEALDQLSRREPRPEYLIAGATHPKVRERHGEAYRDMLVERAAASTAPVDVRFDDTYRDLVSLTELIGSADVVVLPYDSVEQVTSGVLVDAVAAGRPVVSTAFPHAIELLSSGAGLVVPQRDPVALGRAIDAVLTDRRLAASMAAEARRLAPGLAWSAVARRYARLADGVLASRRSVRS